MSSRTQDSSSLGRSLIVAGGVCLLSVALIRWGLQVRHSPWAALLFYHGALILGLAVSGEWRGFRQKITAGFRPKILLLLFILAALYGLSLWGVLSFIDPAHRAMDRFLGRSDLSTTGLAFAIYLVLINPLLEEAFWRGDFHQRRFSARDAMYSLIHLPIYLPGLSFTGATVGLVGVWLAGVIWRFAARQSGGLACAILGHAFADLALLLAFLAHRS